MAPEAPAPAPAPWRNRARPMRRPPMRATPRPPSTKHLAGDGLEPALGEDRLLLAHGGRRIEGTRAAGTLDIGELAVDGMVDAGDREAVARRRKAVAGVDELRLIRLLAADQLGDGCRAGLSL